MRAIHAAIMDGRINATIAVSIFKYKAGKQGSSLSNYINGKAMPPDLYCVVVCVMIMQVVVSDVPTCGGVQYAQQHNIPTLTYPIPKKGGYPGLMPTELVNALRETYACSYVILAGYLKVGELELLKLSRWQPLLEINYDWVVLGLRHCRYFIPY